MRKATFRLRARKIFFALIVVISLGAGNFAQGDEWVTPKNPKHGYRLLGRVILVVEVRADGTVKRAWPAAASTHSRAAWRAAHAAQELTFRPGSERTMRVPVTVYLN